MVLSRAKYHMFWQTSVSIWHSYERSSIFWILKIFNILSILFTIKHNQGWNFTKRDNIRKVFFILALLQLYMIDANIRALSWFKAFLLLVLIGTTIVTPLAIKCLIVKGFIIKDEGWKNIDPVAWEVLL